MTVDAQIDEFVWRGTTIRVTYNPNRWEAFEETFGHPIAHLEIQVIKPKDAPLPVTETGYRSHHISSQVIEDEGGPVAFVKVWLDYEAQFPKWLAREAKFRQLDLF